MVVNLGPAVGKAEFKDKNGLQSNGRIPSGWVAN